MADVYAQTKLGGTALIEASAGTGKTFTITTLLLRLVLEERLPLREIVVVTFTESATAELRARIRKRLREALALFDDPSLEVDDDLRAIVKRTPDRALLGKALSELDLASISTIHAFCLRALQERAFESGARFGLELTPDTSELAREIAEDYWSSRLVPMAEDLFRLVDLDLDTARELVETFARSAPDVPILPDAPAVDLDRARADLAKYWAAVRKTWLAEGADIRELLAGNDDLYQNQNAYTEPNVEKWCDALDRLFASAEPRFTNTLEKFSATTLTENTKKKRTTPAHPFFRQAERLHELSTRTADDLTLLLRRELADYTRREMAARKSARGVQGFEDLLFALDAALAGPGGDDLARALRGQYRAALIDEFQDTDPVQFRIFRRIFHEGHDGKTPLLFVGDPKQSIYAFRGADVFSYFQAAKDAASGTYTLDTNHRSDPTLVRAVNSIFKRAKNPFVFAEIEFRPVDAFAKADRLVSPSGPERRAAFEILFLPRKPGQDGPHNKGVLKEQLPALVAADIARFLASGATIEGKPVRAGDVAVLTRSNAQASAMQEALRTLGIPTVLESESSVFESLEARELEQLLRAVLEPTRTPVLRSALATSIAGLTANAIVALENDESAWQEHSERFRKVQEVWATRGFMPAYRRLLTELGAEPRLLAYVDGERRVTNLVHLGDLLHAAARRERLGPSGVVRWLGAMRAAPHAPGRLEGEASELRLESDARAVKLLTIHKSKGLEYPVVYCPFLWSGGGGNHEDPSLAYHDPKDAFRLKLHLAPNDDAQEAAAKEDQAEAQRLLYVALTRAKHRCAIVWGAINESDDCCLAYTLHPGAKPSEMSDADLRKALGALAKASEGAIAVCDLTDDAPPKYVAEDVVRGELASRTFGRKVDGWWRVGSFSGMTSGDKHGAPGAPAAPEPEAEGRDRDDADEVDEEDDAVEPEAPVLLHAFPRGAKAGTMLHAVLEDLDFPDRAALPALAREKLTSFGFDPEALAAPLVAGIDAMLDTPLGLSSPTRLVGSGRARLRDIPRARRIDELEFLLPVTQAAGKQVTSRALAEAFANHRTDVVPAQWVEHLAALNFLPLRGYLRGFIDLVFEHEGRFWVVDYKSNHLGTTASAYAPRKLAAAMSHASYFLQYHLYTVAVHRWLRQRMRDYDYDRAFGGVLYLFARGMSPDHPEGTGIFRDRPRRELVEALSEVLDAG